MKFLLASFALTSAVMVLQTIPTTSIGLIAVLGAIALNGIISIITLLVSRQTHKVSNSRLTETINKVDSLKSQLVASRAEMHEKVNLLMNALEISQEQTRVASGTSSVDVITDADEQAIPSSIERAD